MNKENLEEKKVNLKNFYLTWINLVQKNIPIEKQKEFFLNRKELKEKIERGELKLI